MSKQKIIITIITFIVLALILGYAPFSLKELVIWEEKETVSPQWGKIANKGFENQKIAATLYFPGVPRGNNVSLFTANPLSEETGFSENDITRQLQRMKSIGINTVQISFFGRNHAEGNEYLPMDASSGKDDGDISDTYKRLVQKTEQQNMLFFPLIEVSDKFIFWREFPGDTSNMINRISWWIENFGNSPNWMEVHNNKGQPQKVVSLIESIKYKPYDATAFSKGFKIVADRIYDKYKINIGFSIDPTLLPPEGFKEYGPQPNELQDNGYILFILPWDITVNGKTEAQKLDYAKNILKKWKDKNYPVTSFVIAGYDASKVFPSTKPYGKTDEWRESQKELAKPDLGNAGISVGPWNGWTEYFHVTCSKEEKDKNLKWAKEIIDINNFRKPDSSRISCPSRLERRQIIKDIKVSSPITPFESGGDLWFSTWADDDNLYASWGDGTGPNCQNCQPGRIIPIQTGDKIIVDPDYSHHGLARLDGELPNVRAEVVKRHMPLSDRENNSKPSSLLFYNGRLYAAIHYPLGDAFGGFIAYSDDYGKTFKYDVENSPWKKNSNFRSLFFVNMGKDYELNKDGYVYAFGIGTEWDWDIKGKGKIYLARVPKDKILNYSVWEYFIGLDNDNNPKWSKDQFAAVPVENLHTWDQFSSIYHPGINRYLILSIFHEGEGRLYEAPNPWGPWILAGKWFEGKNSEWFGNYQPGIITKDIGTNTFYFTAAGQAPPDPSHPYGNYRFKIGQITMILKD